MTTDTNVGLSFDVCPSDATVPASRRAEILAAPGFVQSFTDHMVTIRWSRDRGWNDAKLEPYGPLTLDPATSVLHYAQEIFEGLKAYRQVDGSIVTFRPQANAARFRRSARRLAMPELPEELFVRAIDVLVTHDRDWVPAEEGNSLYLRPFMIAPPRGLGVHSPSYSYLFLVIASPVAAYFSGGVRPVTVWLSEDYTRAAPGGTGEAKCGGNYAASFVGQREAVANGCDQVVWLDAAERRWVEEMGGMNLFFVYGDSPRPRLVTPPLSGTILPGVTRDAVLSLASDLGISTVQTPISVEQWKADSASGALTETFACGTAAGITPVGHVRATADSWSVSDGKPGPVTGMLARRLADVQRGRADDPHR